jgi:YidC/Oxa1 family membrane protein insertase
VDFLSAIGSFIMTPLYYLISVVLVGFHQVFGAVFGDASGASWALSIVGLTVVIRAALIPLFVKQIKSSRNMQLLQPKVKELQKKYGHDRERLAQEQMKLFKETGTNPFSSCLPILVQMPIFFALFRLLDKASKNAEGHGVLSDKAAAQFANAKIFGGEISSTFVNSDNTTVKVIAAALVLAMTATTFLTQRQLMSKNMPADAMSGPYAQQQKMLLYWTTSNLWTMGQQFYVIRNNPAPNTEAFRAKERRDEEKRRRKGEPEPVPEGGAVATEGPAGPPVDRRPAARQQPKRQSRQQRKKK